MNCRWLSQWAYENRAMILAGAWMAVSAVIVTMPEPGTKLTWGALYAWLFDALHQFSNLKRTTGTAATPPQRIN